MYYPVQAGLNLWEIFLRKVLKMYGLKRKPNGYGEKRLRLMNVKAANILFRARELVPYILKYMGAGNFMKHGKLWAYGKKGVRYEEQDWFFGFSFS